MSRAPGRPRRRPARALALAGACVFACALAAGCGSWVPNRPIFASGYGRPFPVCFDAAIRALERRGHAIVAVDRAGGRIVTAPREKRSFWWRVDAEVQETGDVFFFVSGSPEVTRKGEITGRVHGYGRGVKVVFEELVQKGPAARPAAPMRAAEPTAPTELGARR